MIRIPRYSVRHAPEALSIPSAPVLTRKSTIEERHQWWLMGNVANPKVLEENDIPDSPEIALDGVSYSLRKGSDLHAFFSAINAHELGVIIDITTLSYSSWTVLIKHCFDHHIQVHAAYAEPKDYMPPKLDAFELSERVAGVRGISGFLYLDSEIGEQAELLIFLGFEGRRAAHVIRVSDVPEQFVTPIIGVPAFVPEFTQYSFIGNRRVLKSLREEIRYVRANCPFSAAMMLDELVKNAADRSVKVALLGTRPHSLGAVIYYLTSTKRVGLIYDFPIPRPGRSEGCRCINLYDISRFYAESKAFGF